MFKFLKALIFMFIFISSIVNPITIKAATAPSGTGTLADPYLIASLDNLAWVRDEVNDGTTGVNLSGRYFKQTANIDMSTISNWTPIGTSTNYFSGYYDGNGYTISNLTISSDSSNYYVGLFGYASGNNTYIKNLGITNANVSTTNLYSYSGILVGSTGGSINFNNVFTSGSISMNCSSCGSSYAYIGGIGGNLNGGVLSNSYSTASVLGNNNNYWINAGGLAGGIDHVSVINSFYSGSLVQGWYKGRLFGSANNSTISNTYYTIVDSLTLPYFNYSEPNPVDTISEISSAQLNISSTFLTTDYFSSVWDSSIWNITDGSLPQIIPPSNDADLSSLTFSNGTITFIPSTTSYTFNVDNSVSSITVTPTVNESHATVKVENTTVSSGTASGSITLVSGTNTITVNTTAQDGITTKIYTLTVKRGVETHLSSFKFNTALVNTDTEVINTCSDTSYVTNCTFNLSNLSSYDITDHAYIKIVPTSIDPDASIQQISNISQATIIPNGTSTTQINLVDTPSQTITFYVTSGNGQSGRTYNLTIVRPRYDDALLSNLVLSSGTILFSPQTQTYSISVPNSVSSIVITPTLSKSLSTLTVNGVTNGNATASVSIALNFGMNSIPVVVTAEDGSTTLTYNVNVTRLEAVVVPLQNSQGLASDSLISDPLPNTGIDPSLVGMLPIGLALLALKRKFK